MKDKIHRNLQLDQILKRKSLFLFGPRLTGKSTYIVDHLPKALSYSLLQRDLFFRLNKDPSILRKELEVIPNGSLVVVDEIQKLPELLDEVHYLIERKKHRFVLTGSSARKLKRSGVNLLGGRATEIRFHPLNFGELRKVFELDRALNFGTLPSVYLSPEPEQDLKDYVGLYLKEEIHEEGLVRKLPNFSRFLEVAALSNGQMINFTQIANDAQISPSVCYEYFQILKDTLIADELECWQKSKKRKALATGKFYFFDTGVLRTLQGRTQFKRNDPSYGEALETYFYHELKTYLDYYRLGHLYYWRTTSQFEVDFIINDRVAIELKSKANPSPRDLKGLAALKEEQNVKSFYLVCFADRKRKEGPIEIWPFYEFLEALWDNQLSLG